MAKTQLKHFINGEYVASKGNDYFDLVVPVTGEVYAQSPNATEGEVDAAYAAAKEAFKIWGRSTPSMRQKALLKLADAIEANAERLIEAQSRNTGQLKHLIASEEVGVSADQVRFLQVLPVYLMVQQLVNI